MNKEDLHAGSVLCDSTDLYCWTQRKAGEYIIWDGNSLLISRGATGGFFLYVQGDLVWWKSDAVQRWWCWKRGPKKCLLVSPFLFTVIRKRKAPAVLVPSISPGLWSIQGLNWTINQTHISEGTQDQDTGISCKTVSIKPHFRADHFATGNLEFPANSAIIQLQKHHCINQIHSCHCSKVSFCRLNNCTDSFS